VSSTARLPRRSDDRTQRGRGVLIALVWVAAVIGVVGVILLVTASSLGSRNDQSVLYAFLLPLVFAFLPLPVLWLAYWWLDRYEPEPLRYKFAAIIWGAVIATSVSLVIQLAVSRLTDISDRTLASWIAPVTEEPAKCLFLILTFVRARKVIDGFLDGLIYAGLIGIGFALLENVGYYALSYAGAPGVSIEGTTAVTATFVVRGIFSPLAHPLFTSAFGIAIGLAITQRSWIVRILLGLVGLAASIGLHHLWNASLSQANLALFAIVYLCLGILIVILVVFAVIVRSRQVRVLEKSLSYIALRGWIDGAEVPWLTHFDRRKSARRFARRHGGAAAARAMKRYQHIAADMAFLHHNLMIGRAETNGVARTHQMLERMHRIRPMLVFPPPLHKVGTNVY